MEGQCSYKDSDSLLVPTGKYMHTQLITPPPTKCCALLICFAPHTHTHTSTICTQKRL